MHGLSFDRKTEACLERSASGKNYSGVHPEYIHYWDAANDTLDLRSTTQVYSVQNLYRDCKNTENVNVVEEKLAALERKAADVTKELLEALPTDKFSVKRRSLEDLLKFLFIIRYRLAVLKDNCFDENLPDNAWTKS